MNVFGAQQLVGAGQRDADTNYQGPQLPIQRWDSAANTVTFGVITTINPATQDVSVVLRGAPDVLASSGGPIGQDRQVKLVNNAAATWVLNNGLYWAIFPDLDRYPYMRVTIVAVGGSTSQSIVPFLLA